MMHGTVQLEQVSLIYPHKICFEHFTAQICYGDRIAIIGRNGAGKSSLLNVLLGQSPFDGHISVPKDVQFGYVPQLIEAQDASGAERFHNSLTTALSSDPNFLLLDEPTNHLDLKNHCSLLRLLNRFNGTLVIVSHDPQLLKLMNVFWEIESGKVHMFEGNYNDFLSQKLHVREKLENALDKLKEEKESIHQKLMRDQGREKKRRLYGENKYHGDKIALRSAQGSGERTTAKNRKQINQQREELLEKLGQIQIPKIIRPTFSITPSQIKDKVLLDIQNGSCGYQDTLILEKVYFAVGSSARIALQGSNKSGKTTLIKAMLNDPGIKKAGQWTLPRKEIIGYVDQHYQNLCLDKTVLDSLQEVVPTWSSMEIRDHLSTFLFFKNEEVNLLVKHLSGGEKARLSLAIIAAKTPRLLILDEITNNLDRQTKEHVVQVLLLYPGALIVISHDNDFLNSIKIKETYEIKVGQSTSVLELIKK